MRATRVILSLPFVLGLSACSSVEVPQEQYYRIAIPTPSGGELPNTGVLRVGEFRLTSNLSNDALMVGAGPVRLMPYELHRWVGPLDRMIADVVAIGLSRSKCFAQVKTAADPGREDMTLHGRVIDFHLAAGEPWTGEVGIQVWLESDHGARTWFQHEFHTRAVASAPAPEAGVAALSRALAEMTDQIVARMKEEGIFSPHVDATPGK